MPTREHHVRSTDLTILAREHSPTETGPHVVLVHGYPDQQELWDPMVALLRDDFHVVTYDVRGAGGSDTPASRDGYRTELLVEDLIAVVEATIPDAERFHLVGHDWGSVQGWDVVASEGHDARLHGRIASYTSISGPSLDHVAAAYRHTSGRRLRMLNQAVHSWYVAAFHVPKLPELIWNRQRPRLAHNGANGLNLYRANIRRRMRAPGTTETDVPVLVIVPTKDSFVRPVLLEDLDQHCSNLRRVDVDAGHWVPRSHPEKVAALVREHVSDHSA